MILARRKSGKVITSCFCLLLLSSCAAGSSAYMKPSTSQFVPTQDKALVRFMRPSGYGFTKNFIVLDGGKVIGNSVAMSQFDYLTDPGHHLFISISENKVFLEADLVPGKVYHIITRVYAGGWRPRVAFLAVTRGSALWETVLQYEKDLQRLEPDQTNLNLWEDGHKEEIQALLSAYESEFKTKYDWPKLTPEDGR